jgi:hypothetical protein
MIFEIYITHPRHTIDNGAEGHSSNVERKINGFEKAEGSAYVLRQLILELKSSLANNLGCDQPAYQTECEKC